MALRKRGVFLFNLLQKDGGYTERGDSLRKEGVPTLEETMAYLAMKYFTKHEIADHEFIIGAALALTNFNTCASFHETRSINMSRDSVLYTLEKIEFSKACQVPICKPTKCECWDLHIMRGLPRKRYLRK